MLTLTGYRDRDFAERIALLEGQPLAALSAERLGAITRVVLDLGAVAVDSLTAPDVFEWPASIMLDGQAAQGLRIDLRTADLPNGTYYGRLVVYDPDHPHGTPWAPVTVRMME